MMETQNSSGASPPDFGFMRLPTAFQPEFWPSNRLPTAFQPPANSLPTGCQRPSNGVCSNPLIPPGGWKPPFRGLEAPSAAPTARQSKGPRLASDHRN